MNESDYKFEFLPDGRSLLPKDTVIELSESGGRYRIIGEPVGYGGASILYPAITMIQRDSGWTDGSLMVVIKECFPSGLSPIYKRAANGEIIASMENNSFYSIAKEMLFRESEISGKIYKKGFRLTPVQRTVGEETIQLPGRQEEIIHNVLGILERLDEKGMPLSDIFSNHISGWQCFHLFGQVLRAIGEVHEAGFLHGDIHEHNIFVKGWERDENSCEISIVDFGSARKLLADGATDVITDRVLFATKGYAAPECLEKNDGTLRLTPAADLYSSGILLLRMLNGRLPERRALQVSVGTHYLLQRRARQIQIPSGTIPKINELLSGLLKHDPAERYQSVDEVLEISDRIEKALSPRTSALEAIDYDAFICYSHEPLSSVVAQYIQKRIEHYHIPKTVKRPDGKLIMGKVFLDRAELIAGGDMEEHLRSALAHSAFLIVIFSSKTKESLWVEREIRMFLESHSRDQILTVLAEGELKEVTPFILQECEKEVDGVMRTSAVESLAADVRGSDKRERNKKLKTEIYRILAPILGCGYDDLVQRQKVYRQQKLLHALFFAFMGSLCILGVIGRQAVTINKNYRDALKRESLNLAKESAEALMQGDRRKAVSLALESLPDIDSHSDRPVTEQAKAALIQSMGYYQGERQHSITLLRPDSVLQMEYSTDRYGDNLKELEQINDEETCLASVDKKNTVYAWNLIDGSLFVQWSGEDIQTTVSEYFSMNSGWWDDRWVEPVRCLTFESEYILIIMTDRVIMEANIKTGHLEVRGEYPVDLSDDVSIDIPHKVISMPKFNAVVICRLIHIYKEESFYRQWQIEVIDRASVKTISTLESKSILKEECDLYSELDEIKVVGDGSCIAIVLSDSAYKDEKCSKLIIWYPQEERSFLAELDDHAICHVSGLANNVITVVTSNTYYPNYSTGEFPDTRLSMIELSDGSCRFSTSVDIQVDPYSSMQWGVEKIGSKVFGIENMAYFLFWCGRKIYLYTAKEGKEVLSVGANADVREVLLVSDDKLNFCTEKGEIFDLFITGEIETCMDVKLQTDRFIYHPEKEIAWIFNRKEGKITVLRPEVDNRCQTVNFNEDPDSGMMIFDDHVVTYEKGEDIQTQLSLYDIDFSGSDSEGVIKDREKNVEAEDAGDLISDVKIMPDMPVARWKVSYYVDGMFYNNGKGFLYWEKPSAEEEGMIILTARSTVNGELIWKTVIKDAVSWDSLEERCDKDAKKIIYDTVDGFVLFNLESGEEILQWSIDEYEKDQDVDLGSFVEWEEIHLTLDGKYVIALIGNDSSAMRLCVLDIEKNKWKELSEELSGLRMDCSDYFNRCIFVNGSGKYVTVYCDLKRSAFIIDTNEWSIYSSIPFVPSGDRYLALTSDDRYLITCGDQEEVRVIDMITGNLISKSEEVYGLFAKLIYYPDHKVLTVGKTTYYYLTDDGQLVLIWKSKNSSSLRKRMFVTIDYNRNQLRFYPIRTLNEMIEEAKERYNL